MATSTARGHQRATFAGVLTGSFTIMGGNSIRMPALQGKGRELGVICGLEVVEFEANEDEGRHAMTGTRKKGFRPCGLKPNALSKPDYARAGKTPCSAMMKVRPRNGGMLLWGRLLPLIEVAKGFICTLLPPAVGA